jgi:hypothetical protein
MTALSLDITLYSAESASVFIAFLTLAVSLMFSEKCSLLQDKYGILPDNVGYSPLLPPLKNQMKFIAFEIDAQSAVYCGLLLVTIPAELSEYIYFLSPAEV